MCHVDGLREGYGQNSNDSLHFRPKSVPFNLHDGCFGEVSLFKLAKELKASLVVFHGRGGGLPAERQR